MNNKRALLWIWLKSALNDSSEKTFAVFSQFKDIEAIYHAGPEDYGKIKNISKDDISNLLTKDLYAPRETLKLCEENRIDIIPIDDERYPKQLMDIEIPPTVLFAYGNYDKAIANPMVTIVGTRECTHYGEKVTKEISQALAYCGCTIVSGIAEGIDRCACIGAGKANGMLIMVLPAGHLVSRVDSKIPGINYNNTVLLSEHLPKATQTKFAYHERNRILSALSELTIITQAPRKSGALITANYALEQGKDVYSLPANIDILASEGSNRLFAEGAIPILSYKDALEPIINKYPDKIKDILADPSIDFLKPLPDNSKQKYENFKKTFSPLLSNQENKILSLFSDKPLTTDYIVSKINRPIMEVTSTLTSLVFNGAIIEQQGGKYKLNIN